MNINVISYFLDLFAVRVADDQNRMVFFDTHVSKCIENLKDNLFVSQMKRRIM